MWSTRRLPSPSHPSLSRPSQRSRILSLPAENHSSPEPAPKPDSERDAEGNPLTVPVSGSQARRDWYKGHEGMKYFHSHSNYSRFNEMKYRIELAFDESSTATGLMQYLKRLGM